MVYLGHSFCYVRFICEESTVWSILFIFQGKIRIIHSALKPLLINLRYSCRGRTGRFGSRFVFNHGAFLFFSILH